MAVEAFISSTRGLGCGYRQRQCGLIRRRGGGVRSYTVSSDRAELSLNPKWDKRTPHGAGVTSMGLVERFFRVAKANLNSILKVSENGYIAFANLSVFVIGIGVAFYCLKGLVIT